MLKTDSLPVDQQARNGRFNREVGKLGVSVLLLFLLTTGGLAALYFSRSESQSNDHQVANNDGVVLGYAVVVTSTFSLTDADIPDQVQINLANRTHSSAQKVRAEKFEENIQFSLLRSERPFPPKDVPALGTAEPGRTAYITSAAGKWTGALKPRTESSYFELDPPMPLGPGLPVFQEQALVGITAQTATGTVLVPTSALTAKFPEISAGQ